MQSNRQATVTITDADRNVDYILSVDCDFLPGAAHHPGWRHGGEPGAGPVVEINGARCLEVVVWCGPRGISAFPADDERESLERRIGAWCLDHYSQDIEQAALQAFLSRCENIDPGS